MKIVHFIGASKPWHVQFDPAGKPLSRSGEEHANKHLLYWWQIFHSDVSNKNADGGSSQPDRGSASGNRREEGPAHDQGSGAAGAAGGGGPSGDDRRERWEGGQPDYMGSASFDNILKKLESTMSTPGESDAFSAFPFDSSLHRSLTPPLAVSNHSLFGLKSLLLQANQASSALSSSYSAFFFPLLNDLCLYAKQKRLPTLPATI